MRHAWTALALAAFVVACDGASASSDDEGARAPSTSPCEDPARRAAAEQAGLCRASTSSSTLDPASPGAGDAGVAAPTSPAGKLAVRLGLAPRLAFGLGNDSEGDDASQVSAYGLGTKVDVHYMYLNGLPGEGGWTEWVAPEGAYARGHAEAARARGVVPMFTLYQAAAWGDGNLGALADRAFMTKYWRGARALYAALGAADTPAIVHLEPDLWGYAQKKSATPAAVPVVVGALVPECADLPADVSGFGRCLVRLARKGAPKAAVGFSASTFGAFTPAGASDPVKIATYLGAIGGADADLVVVETLDRDAGCFEAASDPACKRAGSGFYWDDAAFRAHLAWAKAIATTSGKPLLWWQMPLGVPSSSPGGRSGTYRDNRVRWVFEHPEEFAAAGGFGAVFGTGAANQTSAKTDGGQFARALAAHRAGPGVPLP